MSETTVSSETPAVPGDRQRRPIGEIVSAGLKKRYAAERRFRVFGLAAIAFAILCLAILFTTIIRGGYTAFAQTMIKLEVTLYPEDIDPTGERDPKVLSTANYQKLVRQAMQELFPEVSGRSARRAMFDLISPGATFQVRQAVLDNPDIIGQRIHIWVPASDDIDQFAKGHITADVPETERRVSDQQIAWFKRLEDRNLVEKKFNLAFFTNGDSREPELAGIWGALVGTLLTMAVTLSLAFPLAVATAVYLEEFAPKNRWTDLIEVNINNLAAVPSIVYGLLGLAVFLNFFGLPRSAPLVGGMVLALMTLPTIIFAARAALKAVPPWIREAALGLGASPMQVIFQHTLPLAMPGILTGTIIGMAQALGETAPLLMIGMVAFIVDIPHGVTDPSTVLPVQIYLWADSLERAFVERTSAAIMVLLGFLVFMNAIAIYLRRKFERRW